MGKKLLEKLENRVYWGLVGVLLTIVFGIMGLYTYFHERKANVQVEVVGESNVLDLHKPLEDLTVYFHNEDIQKKNLNLRIITIQISNTGEMDILQAQFDQKMKWGIKISSGKIINDGRIVGTNSDYLKSSLSPKVVGDNFIEFEKVIFEKNKYFTLEILVLHSKDTLPEITTIGKIAGIDKIPIEKTWETKMRPSFLKTFFDGGFLINFLRLTAAAIVWIILIIAIVLSSETLSSRKGKFKQNKRKKEIEVLFGKESQDEKTQLIIDTYINKGLSGLKDIDEFLKDDKGLLLEIKRFTLEEEYETKLNALLPEKRKDDLIDEESIFLHEREYARVSALLKKKIVELRNQDAVEIDAEFIKSLLRTIQYFEGKANRKIQQTRD
jgi:hypothetical protein